MMHLLTAGLQARIVAHGAVHVQVQRTEGSAPREAGTSMIVLGDGAVVGTIGGGQVEHQAIATAREMLRQPSRDEAVRRYPLGPSLGQCCGGVMVLRFEWLAPDALAALAQQLASQFTPVALFGGGHVGRALVNVLSTLPFQVTWIDSRDEIFPTDLPPNVRCEHSDPVQGAVADLAPGSQVLIMSFSHAEDLDIVAACLRRVRERRDIPFVGLIGSRTKWATFRHRLEQRGFTPDELAFVTCPIGIPGIRGKEPEVIAVGVAAQLLQARQPP